MDRIDSMGVFAKVVAKQSFSGAARDLRLSQAAVSKHVRALEDWLGARLLDRTGKPLPVPVSAATRTDADGMRWATGELVLAPLAPADYIVELSGSNTRTLAAFRVVP